MQLTLVRHGEAHPSLDGNDIIRPLTERGHAQAIQTADVLKQRIQPDIIVVSPLLRAQQTARYLQQYFPNIPVVICQAIQPDEPAKVAVEWLAQLNYASIVVVCHMNVVAYMAQILQTEAFSAFQLAEARIYEQPLISAGLSTQIYQFTPNA